MDLLVWILSLQEFLKSLRMPQFNQPLEQFQLMQRQSFSEFPRTQMSVRFRSYLNLAVTRPTAFQPQSPLQSFRSAPSACRVKWMSGFRLSSPSYRRGGRSMKLRFRRLQAQRQELPPVRAFPPPQHRLAATFSFYSHCAIFLLACSE